MTALSNNIYFVSLGGFAKTDVTKSVTAFSNLLAKESYFPYFTEARVYGALLMDKIYYKTIDSYKLGKIDTIEFKDKISYQLGVENGPEIESAWNAMCELTKEAKEDIYNLFQHQQTEHFKLCLVSSTNPLQYNYVVDQINKELTSDNLLKITGNARVVIKTSFEENTLSISELAKIAIKENNWDSAKYHIISYHSGFTKENLGLKEADFSYDENQSWVTFVGDHPQEL